MNKEQINEAIREAYQRGKEDEYVSQILGEQAQEYYNNEAPRPREEEMTDKEYEEWDDKMYEAITEAYIEGFYGTVEVETLLLD